MRPFPEIEFFERQFACFQVRIGKGGSIFRAGEHGEGEAVRYAGEDLPPELGCFSAYHTFLSGYSFQRRFRQNFLSLEYVVAGEILLRCGNRAYVAEPGDLFLLRPGGGNDWLHPAGSPCEKYGILMRGKLLGVLLEQFQLDRVDFVPGADPEQVKSLFRRIFRQVTGWSPGQYLLECRLRHAEKLLMTSHLRISEISNECGFEDEFHFSRIFKKHRAMSPSRLRALYGMQE